MREFRVRLRMRGKEKDWRRRWWNISWGYQLIGFNRWPELRTQRLILGLGGFAPPCPPRLRCLSPYQPTGEERVVTVSSDDLRRNT